MCGSTFKLKLKVQDDYFYKKNLVTENEMTLITEDNKKIITEWGVKDERNKDKWNGRSRTSKRWWLSDDYSKTELIRKLKLKI